jgi:two-component system, OmpR family, response regulator VicR
MEKVKAKILYAEDDIYLGFVTRDNLEQKGYRISLCANGMEALTAFEREVFDLCILDVMMPEMDGFTLARKIREKNQHIPILFLSAKSMKEDRITGLMTGGDDYITKPFSIEELILKIEVFLKRSKISEQEALKPDVIRLGEYVFDPVNLSLSHKEATVRLTSREAGLLTYFAANLNKVLRKEDILNKVWDSDSYFNSRSLDVFVSKLRKYLKHDPTLQINNIHGIGFILVINS